MSKLACSWIPIPFLMMRMLPSLYAPEHVINWDCPCWSKSTTHMSATGPTFSYDSKTSNFCLLSPVAPPMTSLIYPDKRNQIEKKNDIKVADVQILKSKYFTRALSFYFIYVFYINQVIMSSASRNSKRWWIVFNWCI